MKRAIVAGGVFAIVIALLVLATGRWYREWIVGPAMATPPATTEAIHVGFLHGRITTDDGATYQGRLRWGVEEEAHWGDYFNGSKAENPWVDHVPPEQLMESFPIEIFGVVVFQREREIDLDRPFMARFGDIARIEAEGDFDLQVTLKSGTVFELDRLAADDFGDGVRVWDDRHGVVDLVERQIRSIEFLPTDRPGPASDRLHGVVQTLEGDFTGFVQWDQEWGQGELGGPDSDALDGRTADGDVSMPFDTIQSITRHSGESSLVTLLDESEVEISGTREAGDGNRGIYVDDRRYGRVLISWNAFERVDFSPGGGGPGPAYGDFPPGRPLTGSVTTLAGRRLVGRLIYDLDESETTETLDAPSGGVDYTIPFGLVASIDLPGGGSAGSGDQHAGVKLHHGEELRLERSGDLGEGNAGILIFEDDGERPEHVLWTDVERVDFDRLPAMYPPFGGR